MVSVKNFGETKNGEAVELITITNSNGNCVEIMSLGATVRGICLKTPDGKMRDVVLGYETVGEYEENDGYLGTTVGRCANRIGKPSPEYDAPGFIINGAFYPLADNTGEGFAIHGGYVGFDKKVFSYDTFEDGVDMYCFSSEGEEGYPGNLSLNIRFTFDDDDALHIVYTAESDKDTVCNLTNHSYFNLDGQDSGAKAMEQTLRLSTSCFTEVDKNSIPTGKIIDGKGTAMDFTVPAKVGSRIDDEYPQLMIGTGYDINFAFGNPGEMKITAILTSADGHVELTEHTTMPGMQLYTSNFLTERNGKQGAIYGRRNAVCLETQNYPNAINRPSFPSPLLKKGEINVSETVYAFKIK